MAANCGSIDLTKDRVGIRVTLTAFKPRGRQQAAGAGRGGVRGDIRHRDHFDFADIGLSPTEQSDLLTDKTIIPAKRAGKVMRGYLRQFDTLAMDEVTAAGLRGAVRTLSPQTSAR
jgi:hypothetical protein